MTKYVVTGVERLNRYTPERGQFGVMRGDEVDIPDADDARRLLDAKAISLPKDAAHDQKAVDDARDAQEKAEAAARDAKAKADAAAVEASNAGSDPAAPAKSAADPAAPVKRAPAKRTARK